MGQVRVRRDDGCRRSFDLGQVTAVETPRNLAGWLLMASVAAARPHVWQFAVCSCLASNSVRKMKRSRRNLL